MMRKAKVEFHYAADERNPVRYRAGADVPVKADHVAGLVADGKIELTPRELAALAEPIDLTDEERAALPPLDPSAPDDPLPYVSASTKRGRRRK